MRTVELRPCTRTLRIPQLQDVYDIISSHQFDAEPLHIDLKSLSAVGGAVKGLCVSPALGYKATAEKHLVIAAGALFSMCRPARACMHDNLVTSVFMHLLDM